MLRPNCQCWEGGKKNSPPIGVVYSQLTSKSEVGNLTSNTHLPPSQIIKTSRNSSLKDKKSQIYSYKGSEIRFIGEVD